ncbi:MAG: 3TM-type holin, partial [Terriglobales bacterium]
MGLLDLLGPVIGKLLAFIPDPAQKAAAQLALLQANQAGEFKEIDAAVAASAQQNAVNAAEAASPSVF